MKLFTFILIVSAMTGSSATLFNKFDTSHCKCIPKNYPCTQKGYRINFNYARTPSACLPNLFLCCDEGKNKWFMNSKEKLSNKIQKKINSTFNGLQKSASEVNTKTSRTEKELTLFQDSQTKNSSNQEKFIHSPQTTKKETQTPDPKLIDKILNKIPKFNYVATLPATKFLENVTRDLSETKEYGPSYEFITNYISPRDNSSNFTVDLSESNFIKSNSASRNRVIDKVLYRNIHDVTMQNKPNAENKPQNYHESLYSNNFPTNHTSKSVKFVKLIDENEAPIPQYTDEPHEQPLKSDTKYEKGFMEYVTHSSIMPKMQTIDQSLSSKNIINDVSLEVIESNRLQNSKINVIHDSMLIGKKEDAVTKLQRNLPTGHLAPNTQSTKQEDITPAIPKIEQLGKVVMIPSVKSQAEEATLPKLKSQAEEVSIHSVTKPEVAISNVTSLTEVTIPSVPTETEEVTISTITAIIEVTIPSDTTETEESTKPSVTTVTEEVAILRATIVIEEGTIPSVTVTEKALIPSVQTATEEAAISTITTVTEVTIPSDMTEAEENTIPSVTTVTEEATISTIMTATEEATIPSVPTDTEEATIPSGTTVTEEGTIQSGTTVTEGTIPSDTTVAEEMKTSSVTALTEFAIPSVTSLSEVVTIFPKGMRSSAKLNGKEIDLSNVTQASEDESQTQTYTTESTNSTFQENKTETFPFKAIGPHTTKLSKFSVYPRSKDTPNLLRVYNESVDELISFSKKFQIPSRISNSVTNGSLQATTSQLEIDVVQTATQANTTESDESNTASINNLLAESNQTVERKKKVTNSSLPITTDKSSSASKDLNESRRKLPSEDLSAAKNINVTDTYESTKPPQVKQNQSESIFNWIFKIF